MRTADPLRIAKIIQARPRSGLFVAMWTTVARGSWLVVRVLWNDRRKWRTTSHEPL